MRSQNTIMPEDQKEREEQKRQLQREKVHLEKTLSELGVAKDKFFWEIDFAEVFANGGFDVVIGNPPYVREQEIAPENLPTEDRTVAVRELYKSALVSSVEAHWGREFKRDLKSDLYVYFFYHGLAVLKPRGSFVFITSNSWLDVGYGAKLQQFLLRNTEIQFVFDNLLKRSFQEADINTVITVLKKPNLGEQSKNTVGFVMFRKPFEVVLKSDNVLRIQNSKSDCQAKYKLTKTADFRALVIPQLQLWNEGLEDSDQRQAELSNSSFIGSYGRNKWGGKYLRASDFILEKVLYNETLFPRLQNVAHVRLGITSGKNEFFYIPINLRKELGIEQEFVRPLVKSPKDCLVLTIREEDVGTEVLIANKPKRELKGTRVLVYIRKGEEEGIPNQPFFEDRSSESWFFTETISGKILLPYQVDIRHFAVINEDDICVDKQLVCVTPLNSAHTKALCAYLNSSLAIVLKELFGRTNFGQGSIQNSVRDYQIFPCLNFDVIDVQHVAKLEKWMDEHAFDKIANVFEEMGTRQSEKFVLDKVESKRYELDSIIFGALGWNKMEQSELYKLAIELVSSRIEKARSLR